jgi:hypothetical protein
MTQSLTESQLTSLVAIERTSAALSLTGTALIITTFWASKKFRTLPNTLIFYASFGNVISNVAHLVAIAGVAAGPNSALCQIQGFLQQMYVSLHIKLTRPSLNLLLGLCRQTHFGPWLWLAMFTLHSSVTAIQNHWGSCIGNISLPAMEFHLFPQSLSFREGHRRRKGLRRRDGWSILSQYLLSINSGSQLWCWIANDWALLRIATYYGPLWFVMIFIFAIYIRVGKCWICCSENWSCSYYFYLFKWKYHYSYRQSRIH